MGQITTEPHHPDHHVIGPSTGHQCWQVPFQLSEEVIQMKIEARPIEALETTLCGDNDTTVEWLTFIAAGAVLTKAIIALMTEQ